MTAGGWGLGQAHPTPLTHLTLASREKGGRELVAARSQPAVLLTFIALVLNGVAAGEPWGPTHSQPQQELTSHSPASAVLVAWRLTLLDFA